MLAGQIALLTVLMISALFKTASLPIEDWALIAAAGVLPFALMEGVKVWRRRYT
ncbi:hypothetical protein NITLEN_10168 [Nitrospira lenta]|uniref:Cation-transporting P-type ATPase C-terminal domain-containing protein n=1 Tax=Nitrospira lenta TaxID=1436998 RepID=A0A330L2J9_9BACT|nr:hypothetical protein NITLEN_10168 [Nitrospira lenta]